jgi:hypothetical protein
MPRALCVRALAVHVPYSSLACGNCWRDRIKATLKQHIFHPHSVSRPYRTFAKVPTDSTFRTLYIRYP